MRFRSTRSFSLSDINKRFTPVNAVPARLYLLCGSGQVAVRNPSRLELIRGQMNIRSVLFLWNHTPAVDSTLAQHDLNAINNSAQRPTKKSVILLVLKHYYRKRALNLTSYIFISILLSDNLVYFTQLNRHVFCCLM